MLLEIDERDLAYREVYKATIEARKERKKEKKAKINPKNKIPKINTEMKKECEIFFFLKILFIYLFIFPVSTLIFLLHNSILQSLNSMNHFPLQVFLYFQHWIYHLPLLYTRYLRFLPLLPLLRHLYPLIHHP
jgi:hypothetical protein